MDLFVQSVEKCLREIGVDSRRPLVMALSGGADSVALADVLCRLGYKCIAAHCNFHLRGVESNRDQLFVENFCADRGIECIVKHFDVQSYRNKVNASVEMACRDLRYEWFENLRVDRGAQAIAVAHHADDNIETVLLNLIRGTGIKGLRGMRVKNGHIIRPMLYCTRSQVEEYLGAHDIDYVTDSTNRENDYTRNKIRNVLLPLMTSLFPSVKKSIELTARNLSVTESFLDKALEAEFTKYASGPITFDLRKLVETNSLNDAEFILYEWIKRTYASSHLTMRVSDIISSVNQSGKIFPTDDGYYFIDRGILKYEAKHNGVNEVFPFNVECMDANAYDPEYGDYVACFDGELLQSDLGSLWSRHWQNGDRMQPFGMYGSKKLSDIFSNAKISIADKSRIPLLMCGERILWIPGVRRSSLFPVTPTTTTVVRVTYEDKTDESRNIM